MLVLLSLIGLLWVMPTTLVVIALWLVETSRVSNMGLKFSYKKSILLALLPLVSIYILIEDREEIIGILFE